MAQEGDASAKPFETKRGLSFTHRHVKKKQTESKRCESQLCHGLLCMGVGMGANGCLLPCADDPGSQAVARLKSETSDI